MTWILTGQQAEKAVNVSASQAELLQKVEGLALAVVTERTMIKKLENENIEPTEI